MAGERIPERIQQIISSVIVTLLIAGIVGLFDMWGVVRKVHNDSSDMREQIEALTQSRVSSDIKASRYFERTDQQGERVKELNADIQRLESLLATVNKPDS